MIRRSLTDGRSLVCVDGICIGTLIRLPIGYRALSAGGFSLGVFLMQRDAVKAIEERWQRAPQDDLVDGQGGVVAESTEQVHA